MMSYCSSDLGSVCDSVAWFPLTYSFIKANLHECIKKINKCLGGFYIYCSELLGFTLLSAF